MLNRRQVVAALAAVAAGPAAAVPLPQEAAALPAVRRFGALYVVDGWVLTRDDLRRIGYLAA